MTTQSERKCPGPAVVAVVTSMEEADRALAEGADALAPATAALRRAIRAARPAAPLWQRAGADPVDCDRLAASRAAVVAVAAIATWQGAAAVRTHDVRAVRRAVDMTASVRGDRPPASTIRGLA